MRYMGISVEGQKCPVCKGYLFDNDDIVFCPVCGAPHHRECYNSIGHCALEGDHGTEKQFKLSDLNKTDDEDKMSEPPKTAEDETPADLSGENPPGVGENPGMKEGFTVCGNCGKTYSAKEDKCPNCGSENRLVVNAFGMPVAIDPLGGVKKTDETDGITAEEYMNYVRVNTQRYVPKFFSLKKKNKLSWNWGGFIFPHVWFFYRKMYYPGIMFAILTVVASGLSAAFLLTSANIPQEVLAGSYSTMANYIMDNLNNISITPLIISSVGWLLGVAIRIVAALFGDYMYKRSAESAINSVREKADEEYDMKQYAYELQKKGGVDLAMGLLGLFIVRFGTYFFYMI